jgi:two-component system alkaline phosphatase synthesis response regulator PhoP
MSTILIVEDEKNLGLTLADHLNSQGHKSFHAENLAEARVLFKIEKPFIVLMDIELPDGSGLDLAREFRELDREMVLLFLSAQNDPEIRVQGLEIGAHDYITKPFALRELMLRLERLLKTQEGRNEQPDEISHGKLKIFFKRFEVENAQGERISLSQKECAILEYLYKRKNEAVTRDEIIEHVWGEDKYPSNRTVDNYIVTLRKWSDSDNSGALAIQSIRAIGYKLQLK